MCPRARCWEHYVLFLLFINDLPSVLDPGTALRLFANDCLVYRSIDSGQDQLLLQQDLGALNLLGQCWGMVFSTKECQIMHIGKQSRHHCLPAKQRNAPNSNIIGVLGYLKLSTHIKQTSTKAHHRLGLEPQVKSVTWKWRTLL